MEFHPLSNVHPEAKIGENVVIEPFVTIEKEVEIGDGCVIRANAVIKDYTRMGKNCTIFSGAVLGEVPQDLKFKGEVTTLEIGDNTSIREYVTLNRGTASKGKTVIGSNCLIMAYTHVGHDSIIGNNVILGNATQIAGEVVIDDFAILSGGILVHQFVHVGSHVMIQGGSRFGKDVPPYVRAGRDPLVFAGVNLIGLTRRNFSKETIREIQDIYRILYQKGLNNTQAIEHIESEIPASKERDEIINFVKNSERGIISGLT